MIVADVLGHQPFEMPLVERYYMIEQVTAATATERSATPFCHDLGRLVRFGWIPKPLMVLTTSSLKFVARLWLAKNSNRAEKRGVWHNAASVLFGSDNEHAIGSPQRTTLTVVEIAPARASWM
jgi:hypothetical protein